MGQKFKYLYVNNTEKRWRCGLMCYWGVQNTRACVIGKSSSLGC